MASTSCNDVCIGANKFSTEKLNTTRNTVDPWSSFNDSIDLKHLAVDTKCYVRKEKEQEHLKEVWSVQQVPLIFEGISKPSATIEKLLLARKTDHNVALENFETELDSLHKTCEMEIQNLKKNLKLKIQEIRIKIENEKSDFCQVTCLSNEKYEELKDIIDPMMSKERELIDQLFEQIKSVECKRQNAAIQMFKKYIQILRKIYYLQSNDIKDFMENKILEYNQISLDKHKKYEELKLKLRLCADAFKQNCYAWIKEMKHNSKAVCGKNALNDFYMEYENFKNAGLVYFKIIEGKAALCRLKSRKNIIPETIAKWDISVPFTASRFEEQSYILDCVISSIDSTVTNFIKSYKLYMSRHLGRLLNKLKKLQAIVDDDTEETQNEDSKTAQDIYDRVKEQIDGFITELEDTWAEILNNLQDHAKKLFQPLQEFGSPWDVQNANFSKLQESTIQQLENRIIKSELAHLDLQQKVDAEVVKLREDDSVQKLEKRLEQIFLNVDKRVQKYKSDFEEDCKIVRKCTDVVKKDVLTLLNKIEKFLETNNKSMKESAKVESSEHDDSQKSLQESPEDDCLCDLSFEQLILHQFQLIEKQSNELNGWKSKFLKNITSYQPFFEKDIIEAVELWEEELILELSQCLEDNIKVVEDLRDDVRHVYENRLQDLLNHQFKLENQKKSINGLINESSKCADTFLDFTDLIDDFQIEASTMIDELGSKIKHSSQVKRLQNMLKNLKEAYKNKIESQINCVIERLEKKLSLMKNSINNFLDDIKLFKDGGNYSIEELHAVNKEIAVLTKNVQKDESESRTKIKKITDSVNSQINNIEKINLDSLNITMQKLKLQENIINAMIKCEYLVGLKIKQLLDVNNEVLDEVTNFMQQCQNKLQLNELTLVLHQLINVAQKTFQFLRGPFENMNIPNRGKDILPGFAIVKVTEKTPNKDNFPSIIVSLIQDALNVTIDNAKIFYSSLINKKEHPSIPDNNRSCENCIDTSFQQLNMIYVTVFNFWTEKTYKLSQFFKTLKLPSIDSCLLDEGEEKSSETISLTGSDSANLISIKVDANFTQFENLLLEMLNLLQPNTNTYEQINENENSN